MYFEPKIYSNPIFCYLSQGHPGYHGIIGQTENFIKHVGAPSAWILKEEVITLFWSSFGSSDWDISTLFYFFNFELFQGWVKLFEVNLSNPLNDLFYTIS